MAKKHDVLVMAPMRARALAQLEEAYTLHRYDEAEDKDAFLREHGPKCGAIATDGHVPLTEGDLEHLPNIGIVSIASAGFERIDDAALKARGIHFTNASAALREEVADVALLLTLAARRELVAAHHHVRSGDWGRKGDYPLLSAMAGKRVGILGLGQIGQSIARRLVPLNVEIGYTSRSEKKADYRYFPELLDLAEWSDILIVVVPGGPETASMVDAGIMAALGPQGTLVNVARGSVVDEPALIEALRGNTLGNAALDVYLDEPNPNPELTALPNVTLSPHHASGTVETRDGMHQLVVDNLAAYFAGKPLVTPVYDLPGGGAGG